MHSERCSCPREINELVFSIKDRASQRERGRETPAAGDKGNKDEVARSFGVTGSVFAVGLEDTRHDGQE